MGWGGGRKQGWDGTILQHPRESRHRSLSDRLPRAERAMVKEGRKNKRQEGLFYTAEMVGLLLGSSCCVCTHTCTHTHARTHTVLFSRGALREETQKRADCGPWVTARDRLCPCKVRENLASGICPPTFPQLFFLSSCSFASFCYLLLITSKPNQKFCSP